MLAVNDIILNLNDKENPYVKRVLAAINKLKELTNNNIRLQYTNLHITENPEDKRKKEYSVAVRVPMTQRIIHDGIDEKWTYFTDRKKFGEEFKYRPRYFEFRGDMLFNDKNSDIGLLYYLVFVCPNCEDIQGLEKSGVYQNTGNAMKHFFVSMPTFDAIKRSEYKRKESQVTNTIYNVMHADAVKTVAMAMGVINVDQLTDPQLRNMLCDIATSNTDTMEKFFSKLNEKHETPTTSTEEDAVVQVAIDRKIIGLAKAFGRPVWKFKEDGKFTDEICPVVPGENEKEKLFNFLKENRDILEVIKTKVNG